MIAVLSSGYQQPQDTAFNKCGERFTTKRVGYENYILILLKKGSSLMRRVHLFLSALLLFSFTCVTGSIAAPRLVAKIDLSQQRMNVYVKGKRQYSWPVSTARRGFRTPVGSFSPTVMRRMHYSRKYYNSPMPHSVFFLGGYAIHGTGAIKRLGRPASHGCVRLHPSNARRLYSLIKSHGKRNTRIQIVR